MEIATSSFPKTIFVTGIGTDVGKSYATGWLAKTMAQAGANVITQKLIQTGNKDLSEDIDIHRRIMGIPLQPRDLDHTTAPMILSYPASPHLAARIDNVELDYSVADKATEKLLEEYDNVIIEGAGGLMVPLTEEMLTIDYIAERNLPTAIVVNGALGAINHALLSLYTAAARGIDIFAVIYNPYFDTDQWISAENREYLRRYVAVNHPKALFLEMDK